jgi:hypothetical protein
VCTLLALVVAFGCGGGDGGFLTGPPWDYTVTVFTELGTCGPNASMQQLEGAIDDHGTWLTLRIRIPASDACEEVIWSIDGFHLGGTTWDMEDLPSQTSCRLGEAHGYGTFHVTHGQMDLFTDRSRFSYGGNINVEVGGGACLGLLGIDGFR